MLTYLMKSNMNVAEQFDEEVVAFLLEHGYAEFYRTLEVSGVKVHYYKAKGV